MEDLENIERAVQEIPQILQLNNKVHKKRSSYGLKHDLEKFRKDQKGHNDKGKYYISRTNFELAMLKLGYEAFKIKEDTINVYYKIKLINF